MNDQKQATTCDECGRVVWSVEPLVLCDCCRETLCPGCGQEIDATMAKEDRRNAGMQ